MSSAKARPRHRPAHEAKLARAKALRTLCTSKDFQGRLNAAFIAAGGDDATADRVTGLALGILAGLGVDVRGLLLAFSWKAAARKLTLRVRP